MKYIVICVFFLWTIFCDTVDCEELKDEIVANISAIQGKSLRIICPLKTSEVEWKFNNESSPLNFSTSEQRYKEEKENSSSTLVIEPVDIYDKGNYTCTSISSRESAKMSVLKVSKDDYTKAVWPFLCICIQVAVMAVALLIYERRRISKRAESDTEPSPETKPVKTEEQSTVRQRQ